MIKPLLVKKPTSCACGGREAWYVTLANGNEMCLCCTCCSAEPTVANVIAKLHEMGRQGDVSRLELLVRTTEKDVIQQQALVDDELMSCVEENIRYGASCKSGEVKLLVEEIKRLRLELADFEMLCDHTSQVYDWASGGRISKPTTLPSEVIGQGENRIDEQVEEALEERTRGARKLLPALMDLLTGPFSSLPHSTADILADLVIDALDQLPHPEKRWPGQSKPVTGDVCNAVIDPKRTAHRGV